MQKDALTPEAYNRLVESIMKIILANGPKATTMDSVAANLQMSKRTLYEIFGSKEQMVSEVISASMRSTEARHKAVFANASNVLEGLLEVFRVQRDIMSDMSPNFFRDLDTIYRNVRHTYDRIDREREQHMLDVFARGVEQGVFRADANYRVLTRLMKVQMESLKRMEEVFPSDITLVDAYDTISLGLLRSIATPKGMEMLDRIGEACLSDKRKAKDDLHNK